MAPEVTILGYLPPPITGQAIATERLIDMLQPHMSVEMIDMSYKVPVVHTRDRWSRERMRHYLKLRGTIARRLARSRGPVIWPAISSTVPGHLRDLLTISPAIQTRRPVLAVVHRGNIHTLFTRAWTAPTGRWLARKLYGFVLHDKVLASRLEPYVEREKLFVVPNTVPPGWSLRPEELASRMQGRPHTPFRLLFLSNMLPEKGLWDVIEATAILHHRGFPIETHVVGGWTDTVSEEDFRGQVARHGVTPVVTHHGPISDREALRTHFLQADAFVLPTYYPVEAQPLSIIEAMGLATPVITTHQGGIPQMLSEEEAFFVPPRQPEAIVRAIEALHQPDVWQTRARRTFQRFQRQFHPDVVQAHWLRILRPLLHESPPSKK